MRFVPLGTGFTTQFLADNENATINASVKGNTGIALTNFVIYLYRYGAEVANTATVQAAPYNLTIDNAGYGFYTVNIDFTTAGVYELVIKNTQDLISWVSENFNVQEAFDNMADLNHEGNASFTYNYNTTGATIDPATRKVGNLKLNSVTVKNKRSTDADWSAPVVTQTLYCWYDSDTDDNPIKIGEA